MAEASPSLQILALVPCAYVMGFLAAIPVGATQLEIARRALQGLRLSAFMVVAGSVTSDTMYGAIALFGIAPFLQDNLVLGIFWAANACILIAVGIWALLTSKTVDHPESRSRVMLGKPDVAFVTGFSLAVTNPAMVFWWLLGSRVLQEFGVVGQWRSSEIIAFLAAGAMGIGSYLTVLTLGIQRAKTLLSPVVIQRITRGFAIVLLGLGVYAFVRAASIFFKG